MWINKKTLEPPESTPMDTILFPVWFRCDIALARRIGNEINVNGCPSDQSNIIKYWYKIDCPSRINTVGWED